MYKKNIEGYVKKKLTYKDSGVNIDEGERLVKLISPLAKSTKRKGVLSDIGGFGALFSGKFKDLKDPVLVSATDGVGTKLLIAKTAKKHDTIGIDLVAMSVNDIITSGAEPLFFLDYFSCGKLNAKTASTVIKGIAKGCKDAGCALIGGETAEMPGLYSPDEYDLAGFAVGVVDKKKIITGKDTRPGDVIIGLSSSGLHSNGYSLARQVFFKKLKLKTTDKPKGLGASVGNVLLRPTRIYVKPVLELLKTIRPKSIAHITGGGFTENIPRVLDKDLRAIITKGSWPEPSVFKFIRTNGNIAESEMLRTFNCGIGMTIIVKKTEAEKTLDILRKAGEKATQIGVVEKRQARQKRVEFI